ncbi:DUF1566 domain-containing protein [candidate division KSB1 bacterium]|nr:DUF1566 domain-containing protein [candidate division KSB1 bacterium]
MNNDNFPSKFWFILAFIGLFMAAAFSQSYKIVDTGQTKFYNNFSEISSPAAGAAFYGQDAQFTCQQPSYTDNGDGTITDNVTGLMWQKSADTDSNGEINFADKLTYSEALAGAASCRLAGHYDWRLPTIKELYSLIMFYGEDPSGYTGTSTDNLIPFINPDYFDIDYGDTDAGERIIDAQFATSTRYISTTMGGNETMFGVNFVDGRIKGYPCGSTPIDPEGKGFYVLYVRGNTAYGVNDFVNNNNGTITDRATGLMWTQADNGEAVLWQDALAYPQQKNAENYLGHNDWRLPNVKELQSIVDYTRAPAVTNSPAIDPLFNCSMITDEGGGTNYPFYWSGTTHANMQNGGSAAYVAFGEGLGWMEMPPNSRSYNLQDVHGAGCQRSDPKTGDPADYPYGHGPQGDVIRIYNYVRLVRTIDAAKDVGQFENAHPQQFELSQNYPNPFNPTTRIQFTLPTVSQVSLNIYDLHGQEVISLVGGQLNAGTHAVEWQAQNQASGIYFYTLQSDAFSETKRMVLLK